MFVVCWFCEVMCASVQPKHIQYLCGEWMRACIDVCVWLLFPRRTAQFLTPLFGFFRLTTDHCSMLSRVLSCGRIGLLFVHLVVIVLLFSLRNGIRVRRYTECAYALYHLNIVIGQSYL